MLGWLPVGVVKNPGFGLSPQGSPAPETIATVLPDFAASPTPPRASLAGPSFPNDAPFESAGCPYRKESMVVKRLLHGRFQFIRVVSTKHYSKTYLMADHDDPVHPKCIAKHLQLPSHNPITLKFLSDLLNKRINMLKRLGEEEGVAEILLAAQDGRDFYCVRPYIAGQSLQAELATQASRPAGYVYDLLEELLTTLVRVQEKGVVHQNLQPSNIIRCTDNRLVLVDFSLVHESEQLYAPGSTNGSAPELVEASVYLPDVRGRRFSRFNADHFAVGMIAIQVATGLDTEALPHMGQSNFLQQVQLQLDECSSLDPRLKQILLGMVTPRPEKQFHRAKDILAQLTRIGNAPKPPAPPQRPSLRSPRADSLQPHPGQRLHLPRWGLVAAGAVVVAVAALGLNLPQRLQVAQAQRQATAALAQGEPEQALTYLDRVIQLQPDNSAALAQRGNLQWDLGQSEAALEDFTVAMQIDPTNPVLPFERGTLRYYLGDLQGAIADYTTALTLDPAHGGAYTNRGSARAERGDETGAIEDYTAAIEYLQDPAKRASAHLNRCLSHSNLDDHTAALEDCTQAINLQPNNSKAYENRGLVKRRLGDLQGALQDFTIAAQISPDSAEPYYNRGLTRQELGDIAGALEDFNQTLRLNPDHPFVHYDRALIYVAQGQRQQAIADLETTASQCLQLGRLGCYEDARYQLDQLQSPLPAAPSNPNRG